MRREPAGNPPGWQLTPRTHPAIVVIELGTNDCGDCGVDLDAAIDRLLEGTIRWPNLEIRDMARHFVGHPEWHSGDGVHVNEAGSAELASSFVRGSMLRPHRTACFSIVP